MSLLFAAANGALVWFSLRWERGKLRTLDAYRTTLVAILFNLVVLLLCPINGLRLCGALAILPWLMQCDYFHSGVRDGRERILLPCDTSFTKDRSPSLPPDPRKPSEAGPPLHR